MKPKGEFLAPDERWNEHPDGPHLSLKLQGVVTPNLSTEIVAARTRMSELAPLIEAALSQGNKLTAQHLRCERGLLEQRVPVLESQTEELSAEALRSQITHCEQELREADITLCLAMQLNQSARASLKLTGFATGEAVRTLSTNTMVEVHLARQAVEDGRICLARLRLLLERQD